MTKHKLWICPDCNRSFKHPNQWHSCYKGIVDEHFQNKPLETRALFDELIDTLSDSISFSVTSLKSAIYLTAISHFVAVYVRKKYLIIEFSNNSPFMDERVYQTQPYTQNIFTHFIKINKVEDIDDHLIAWITDSYELTGK